MTHGSHGHRLTVAAAQAKLTVLCCSNTALHAAMHSNAAVNFSATELSFIKMELSIVDRLLLTVCASKSKDF